MSIAFSVDIFTAPSSTILIETAAIDSIFRAMARSFARTHSLGCAAAAGAAGRGDPHQRRASVRALGSGRKSRRKRRSVIILLHEASKQRPPRNTACPTVAPLNFQPPQFFASGPSPSLRRYRIQPPLLPGCSTLPHFPNMKSDSTRPHSSPPAAPPPLSEPIERKDALPFVPPSSPVSGEEPRGSLDDFEDSADEKDGDRKAGLFVSTKNPKMSLENLMSPFDVTDQPEQQRIARSPRRAIPGAPNVASNALPTLDPGRTAYTLSSATRLGAASRLSPQTTLVAATAATVPRRAADTRVNGVAKLHPRSLPPYFSRCSSVQTSQSSTATSLFTNYPLPPPNAATLNLPFYTARSTAAALPTLAHHVLPAGGDKCQRRSTAIAYCAEPKAKRPWTESEDVILRELVQKLGPGLWAAMAQQIPGRTGKQVRERWLNHLSPAVTKRPWSPQEDDVIIENHKRIGNCWSRIAKLLTGRSDNSVKNRYYTTLRRRISNAAAKNSSNNASATTSTASRKRLIQDTAAAHEVDVDVTKRARVWE